VEAGMQNLSFCYILFSMKSFALLIYRIVIVIGGAKPSDQLQSNISVQFVYSEPEPKI
jgi:hypothetical protein